MGTLAVLTLIASFIQLASNLGLLQALAKYVAELKGREEDFSAYFVSSMTFKTLAVLSMSLVLFFFSRNLSSILLKSPQYYELIRLTAIDIIVSSFPLIFSNLLLGAGKLKWMALSNVVYTAIRWIAMVMLVLIGYGIHGAVIGWIIGDLCGSIIYAAVSFRLVKFSEDVFRKSISLIPSLLRFSWPLFAASLVSFLYTWYDQALVIAFLPLKDVGVYNISCKAFGVLTGISAALGQSLFPYYGMMYGRKNHKIISVAIKRASRYTMLIMFPLTLGLFSTAKPAITLFAGQQYVSGWPILAIMAVFGLTLGISPALTGLLTIYEKTKIVMLLSIVSVASSLVLLPSVVILGLNGLAIIKGVSLLITLILNLYFLSKVVKVEIDKEALIKALASSTIMAAAVFLMQQFYYSKFLLPIYILIGATIYIAEIRIFKVLNSSDINLLTQILGERNTTFLIKLMGYDMNGQNPD